MGTVVSSSRIIQLLFLIFLSNSVAQGQTTSKIFRLHTTIAKEHGQAAIVFDVNADGLDDLVYAGGGTYHVARNAIRSNGSHRFIVTNYSAKPAGSTGGNIIKGLGLHDYDNDGAPDLYLCKIGNRNGNPNSSGSCRLNNGMGVFPPMNLGINSLGTVRTVVFEDFDGDGNTDSYHSVAPYWHKSFHGNQLYPGTTDWSQFQDNIIDEILDEPHFFHNAKGRGRVGFKAVVVRDFDKDGKPDIITGAYADVTPFYTPAPYHQRNWKRGIFVFRNISQPGQIKFEDVSNQAIYRAYSKGRSYSQMHVYSIVPADFDLDGDLDLFVTGPNNQTAHLAQQGNTAIIRAYRNDSSPGRIKFSNITEAAGLRFMNRYTAGRKQSILLAAGAPIDIDNDGDIDVVNINRAGSSAQSNPYVWRNNGDFTFNLFKPKKHGLRGLGRELSFGDFNKDGKTDLVIVDAIAGSPAGDEPGANEVRIYFNQHQNNNHFVKLKVSYPENQTGVGTKITVYRAGTQEILGYDEIRTDFCYRSKKSTQLHFGLGAVTHVDVKLETPDGYNRVVRDLTADREYVLSKSS